MTQVLDFLWQSHPTACVRGKWVGRDAPSKRKKLNATLREMLKKRGVYRRSILTDRACPVGNYHLSEMIQRQIYLAEIPWKGIHDQELSGIRS
jgi:hypothetical protein